MKEKIIENKAWSRLKLFRKQNPEAFIILQILSPERNKFGYLYAEVIESSLHDWSVGYKSDAWSDAPIQGDWVAEYI